MQEYLNKPKTSLIGHILFVEENENQDFKMATLQSLGYDDKKIKEIRFIDNSDRTTDGSRNQVIGGHLVSKPGKIVIMTPQKELMEKVQFNSFDEVEDGQNILIMTMHIDPQLSIILSCIFGGLKPSKYRLIDFKTGSFTFQGYTTFARRNTVSQQKKIGFVEIRVLNKQNRKPDDYFRAINETFLLKKRKLMFSFLSSCLEFAPEADQFADPFDPDFNDSENFDTFKCNSRMDQFPDIGSFNVCSLEIPFPVATFLLEATAENLPIREEGMVEKISQQTIYLLSLPQRIPVLFQNNNGIIKLSFANFMNYSADYAKSRVQFAVKRLTSPNIMFSKQMGPLVAERYSMKDINSYTIEHNLICVTVSLQSTLKDFQEQTKPIYKNRLSPDDDDDVPKSKRKHSSFDKSKINDLTIFLLLTAQSNQAIQAQKDLFEKLFDEIYDKAALYDCVSCYYTSNYKNPCPLGEHSGERVPFINSKGEEVEEEVLPNGSHRVCYSCCGKVIKEYDIGCTSVTNHTIPDEENEDDAQFEIYTQISEITPLGK